MPWSETTPMTGRKEFVLAVGSGVFSVVELCELYGVSRKTGYKWLARYEQEGFSGLEDRSRTAHRLPHRMAPEVADRILALRRRHPSWGPKKLISRLEGLDASTQWPAPSSAGDLLKRYGLVQPRRYRRRHASDGGVLTRPSQPNDVWSSDFKGQFRTRDRRYCYPLTVADGASRFILEIRALSSTEGPPVRRSFEKLFCQYGLPRVIRTDNGSPFASTGLNRLSRMTVWWTRLGIRHERTAPAHPEQNGSHERMHRTLKAETTRPPEASARIQQGRFDFFRNEFNYQRPHEALGQKTPSTLYSPSPRHYCSRPPELQYPGHFEPRRVGSNGCVFFQGRRLFLSSTLSGELVAFEEVDDGRFSLYFGPLLLARLDQRTGQLHESLPR